MKIHHYLATGTIYIYMFLITTGHQVQPVSKTESSWGTKEITLNHLHFYNSCYICFLPLAFIFFRQLKFCDKHIFSLNSWVGTRHSVTQFHFSVPCLTFLHVDKMYTAMFLLNIRLLKSEKLKKKLWIAK